MIRKLSILVICILFCVNCSSKINQKNFEKLYQSAKAIEGSVSVGVNYQKFGELLQNFATEISIAKEKTKSEEEKELLKTYLEILDTYKDSLRLWDDKISFTCATFYPLPCPIPNGYIYIDKSDPVLKKYEFTISENPNAIGSFTCCYIQEDSIQKIWSKAHEKLEKANKLYLGK